MASEIARILAYAPMLPVELPAYDLTLHGVETDGKTIDLVIGKSAPIARLHLKRAGAGELVKLSAGPKRARAVRKIGDYSHGDELDAHTPKLQSGVSLGFHETTLDASVVTLSRSVETASRSRAFLTPITTSRHAPTQG